MQFRILGPLQVLVVGRPLELGAPKQKALLALLLIHANEVVQPDRILEELWPLGPPAGGVKTLQVHVSKLRKALADSDSGISPVRTEGSGYVIEVGPDELDATRFEHIWRRARQDLGTNPRRTAGELHRALGLWRGPPLADFTYEPFAQVEIRRLEELRLVAIEDAVEADLTLGRHADVLDRLEALVRQHPLRERLRGHLMLAFYRLGRQSEALRTFADLRRLLGEELGIEPTAALCDLEDRILLHDTSLLPPPMPEVTADRLPVRLTSFVGRWRQQAAVRAMLAEHRLVTITGVGGVGKTSLAVEVARDVVDEHPDGIWMVPLASLDNSQLVEAEVAGALGISRSPGVDEVEVMVDYLHDRRGLLVLDNCEHLVDAVAGLTDTLLRRCRELRILAISRRELNVPGEAVFSLAPLEVPETKAALAEVWSSPAAQLLVERVHLKQPGFVLDETTTEPVAVICRRVAGIPLALELAAARLQSMSPADMAERMDDQFELLTAGSRAAEPRQRTLEATMEWSYRLLADDQQAVLRRVAVFRGGFRLEAAEAVAADESLPALRMADLLGQLVEASLVNVDTRGGATTYSLLEPVRQYGLRLLEVGGESLETRERHAEFFSAQAAKLLDHFESSRWTLLMQIGKEIADDCREALGWAVEADEGDTALQLTAPLGPFWSMAGETAEGFASLSAALAASPRQPTPDRIRALDHCARFAIGIGLPADQWLDELEDWAATLGTDEVFGRAAGTRGILAWARGDLNSALDLLEDAYERDRRSERGPVRGVLVAECLIRVGRLDEAEQLLAELDRRESQHDEYGNHWITVTLGMLAFCRGDLPVAEQHLERAVREFGRQRSSSGQMESMMYLGWIALDLGKERRARMLAERSLAMARQEADVLYEATNLWLLARLALRRGELAEARAFLEASTDVARRRRESVSLALALFVWADLAAAEGRADRSARLFGAARQALAGIPHIMPPSIGRGHKKTIDELRRSMGEDVFETLRRLGTEMSLEEAVEYAFPRTADS